MTSFSMWNNGIIDKTILTTLLAISSSDFAKCDFNNIFAAVVAVGRGL